MYKYFFKRVLDILILGVALILIGWLLIIITLFLHFANKGAGAFFFQERPGKDAKIFKVIKFPYGDNNTNTLYFQPVATKKNDLWMMSINMVQG